MTTPKDLSETAAKGFIEYVRKLALRYSLNEDRLPGWIKAAKVRIGWVNHSLVFVVEDSPQSDSYETRGSVGADTAILLNTEDFTPRRACLDPRRGEGLILIVGETTEEGSSVFVLEGPPGAFYNCGGNDYHGPRALANLFLQRAAGDPPETSAMRFIPFAFYLHVRDLVDLDRLWQRCEHHLIKFLLNIHNSNTGDYYERLERPSKTFAMTKSTGVVVLGKDTDPELQELIQVRDYLRGKGYHARLIKDLPEIPMMSNEEKVRLWALASRFCVMIDRYPAGHIAEYMVVRDQRTIMAFLRPRGSGSTYMIGDDRLVDQNYIRRFEFDGTALGPLDEAVEWAEALAQKRADAYSEKYPWR